MINNVTTRYQYVDVKDLRVDVYQREVDHIRIKKMAKNFDEVLLGVITVSYRDGKYNVIDGQHRVMLCKAVGRKSLMAEVKEGMTLEEEAIYFNAFNGADGESKPLKLYDSFRARVVAKDEATLDINEIAHKNGLKFGKANNNNTLSAYKTVFSIYRKEGSTHLDRVFKIIISAWNGEAISLHNMVIVGVSEFIKTYDLEENYSDKTFSKQLSKIDPQKLIREMKSDATTVVTKVKAMNSLLKYYNLGLRKRIDKNLHFSMR